MLAILLSWATNADQNFSMITRISFRVSSSFLHRRWGPPAFARLEPAELQRTRRSLGEGGHPSASSFSFPGGDGLGEDSTLIDLIERLPKLPAVRSANHVASHFLEKRKFLRARVEGHEGYLNRAFALRENLARDVIRSATGRVLPVGDDKQVLAEHARA